MQMAKLRRESRKLSLQILETCKRIFLGEGQVDVLTSFPLQLEHVTSRAHARSLNPYYAEGGKHSISDIVYAPLPANNAASSSSTRV